MMYGCGVHKAEKGIYKTEKGKCYDETEVSISIRNIFEL